VGKRVRKMQKRSSRGKRKNKREDYFKSDEE